MRELICVLVVITLVLGSCSFMPAVGLLSSATVTSYYTMPNGDKQTMITTGGHIQSVTVWRKDGKLRVKRIYDSKHRVHETKYLPDDLEPEVKIIESDDESGN